MIIQGYSSYLEYFVIIDTLRSFCGLNQSFVYVRAGGGGLNQAVK